MIRPEDFEAATPLAAPAGVVDRRRFLVERARGRRVVHLGCADERLTRARAGTGNLLHQELARVADELIGVDLSEQGLQDLSAIVPGVYRCGDVERLGEVPLPDECDLVIAAELIEHLGRPVDFLGGLRDYLQRTGATALVTTPNAYSWTHFVRYAVRRREWVHPDHLCLYSPTTLAESVERSGLVAKATYVHAWSRGARGARSVVVGAVDRMVLRVNPWLGVGLVVEVSAAPIR